VAGLARFGLLTLNAPFDALAHDLTIAGLVFLATLELIGDKAPVLDSVTHAVQWPLAAAAGAILFASQSSVISWASPELAIIVGLLTGGAVHGVRAAARPSVTAMTAGLGNTAVSLAEDAFAILLAFAAVLAPGLAVFLLVVLLVVGALLTIWLIRNSVRAFTWLARRARRGPARTGRRESPA
jgi:hypothetical protein